MKTLTLALFLLYGSFAFGQLKTDNKKLTLIQDIFNKTTKDNINTFMKDKGFEKGDVEEGEDDIKEIYAFSSKIDLIEISYGKNNKISSVICVFSGAINTPFIEIELKNNGYSAKVTKQTINGQPISKNIWSKSVDKFNFVTYSDEAEKIGVLGYGLYK